MMEIKTINRQFKNNYLVSEVAESEFNRFFADWRVSPKSKSFKTRRSSSILLEAKVPSNHQNTEEANTALLNNAWDKMVEWWCLEVAARKHWEMWGDDMKGSAHDFTKYDMIREANLVHLAIKHCKTCLEDAEVQELRDAMVHAIAKKKKDKADAEAKAAAQRDLNFLDDCLPGYNYRD